MQEFITPSGVSDAINIMLSAIGEAPVNTLEGPLTSDIAIAKNILLETNREVQSAGWVVNTEPDFPLMPDGQGHIPIPDNTLLVLPQEYSRLSLAVRGGRLYDLKAHSFMFPGPIKVTVVFLIPFEDLTEKLRRFITIRAARVFQDRVLGSREAHGVQEQDEQWARIQAVQENADLTQANVMSGNTGFLSGWEVADILRR